MTHRVLRDVCDVVVNGATVAGKSNVNWAFYPCVVEVSMRRIYDDAVIARAHYLCRWGRHGAEASIGEEFSPGPSPPRISLASHLDPVKSC